MAKLPDMEEAQVTIHSANSKLLCTCASFTGTSPLCWGGWA